MMVEEVDWARAPPNRSKTSNARRLQTETQFVADRETGVIKWYNSRKGYGFITRESGDDLFVHFTALGTSDEIREGQRVEFDISESGKGPMAQDVRLL
ncbi:MAG: cold-shock protein [Candidatus Latescibacterota bacterium]|nr:cold-shock protein [Candidatus Latescibacterota bacterium]